MDEREIPCAAVACSAVNESDYKRGYCPAHEQEALEHACAAMWLAWDRMTRPMRGERRERMRAAIAAYLSGTLLEQPACDKEGEIGADRDRSGKPTP
jgi:hypothetical protein